MLTFPAVGYHDDDVYVLQVLSNLLGGGMSSRLFTEVRERRDARNLIDEWQARHAQGRWLWTRDALLALNPLAPGPVLGLFESGHMQFEHDRAQDVAGEPSLAEMTRFALRKLAALEPAAAWPGHAKPATGDVRAQLERAAAEG